MVCLVELWTFQLKGFKCSTRDDNFCCFSIWILTFTSSVAVCAPGPLKPGHNSGGETQTLFLFLTRQKAALVLKVGSSPFLMSTGQQVIITRGGTLFLQQIKRVLHLRLAPPCWWREVLIFFTSVGNKFTPINQSELGTARFCSHSFPGMFELGDYFCPAVEVHTLFCCATPFACTYLTFYSVNATESP